MRIARAPRGNAAHQVIHRLIRQAGDLDIEQSHIDVLAHSGAIAMRQRRQNSNRCVQAGENVGHGDAGLLRPCAGARRPRGR